MQQNPEGVYIPPGVNLRYPLNQQPTSRQATCAFCKHDKHVPEECHEMVPTGAFSYEGDPYFAQCDCGFR